MFLGFFSLGATLATCLQLANGSAPQTADETPTFRIYHGDSSTPVATGSLSASVVDTRVGFHSISQALTVPNNFAVGVYILRVAYQVATVDAVQEWRFQIK